MVSRGLPRTRAKLRTLQSRADPARLRQGTGSPPCCWRSAPPFSFHLAPSLPLGVAFDEPLKVGFVLNGKQNFGHRILMRQIIRLADFIAGGPTGRASSIRLIGLGPTAHDVIPRLATIRASSKRRHSALPQFPIFSWNSCPGKQLPARARPRPGMQKLGYIRGLVVEPDGIEPTTSCLQSRRSTN